MKNVIKLFVLFTMSISIISCGEETCDVLSETAVGTWNTELNGGGEFTLNEDGSLTDNNQLFFDQTFDGADFGWNVSGNTLSIQAVLDGTTTSTPFDVTSFDCDNITANIVTTTGDTISTVLTRI